MNPKNVALILSALLLTACAPLATQKTGAPQPASVKAEQKRPDLPVQELNEQVLYELLLGEIAGQRGELNLATDAYLDLAKTTRDYRLAQRAAEVALYSRKPQQALEAAKLWLELDPESVPARQAVAALLVNSGQLSVARPYLEQLIAEEDPSAGHGFLHLNSLLAKQTDKAAAFELVRDLAQPYPQLAEARFAVARAAWNAGMHEVAQTEIHEALRLKPDWEGAALFQGQLLARVSAAQAADFYRDYLKNYPKAPEVRLSYARILVQEKQYPAAREQFRQLMQDFPGNPDVSFAVGLLSLQLDDYDSAESYFKDALANRFKDEDLARLYLGQMNEERKRYDEARTWYGSINGAEHYLTAQIRYAGVLAKQGKLDEARKYLQQVAVQNNQQRVQVVLAEAQLLRDAKSYQESYDLLGRALEKLPNYPDLLYEHAMAAEKINRLDVLEQDLRKLIQLKPDYAHAYNALGYTLADRTTRYDEAQQLLEKALKLAPDDPFIVDSMGWLQYRMGQYAKAVSTLRRAMSLRPDPEIAAHLGEVLWVSGEHDEAQKVWSAALKDNPEQETLLGVINKFKQ